MSLPIQCVEAVFIACRLTAGLDTVERIPLSFKSKFRSVHYTLLTIYSFPLLYYNIHIA